jgi:hypothetical protein
MQSQSIGESTLSAGAFSSLVDDIILLLLGSAGPHNLADNREAPVRLDQSESGLCSARPKSHRTLDSLDK